MTSLGDSISALRASFDSLRRAIALATNAPAAATRLVKLNSVIEGIGQGTAAPRLICPEEYRSDWEGYREGRRTYIEGRCVRYLCWEPDIATSPEFLEYLRAGERPVSARMLQGLAWSLQRTWGAGVLAAGGSMQRVRQLVAAYSGSNRILKCWQRDESVIFDAHGPAVVGRRVIEKQQTLSETCSDCYLDATSAFAQVAVDQAIVAWIDAVISGQNRNLVHLDDLVFTPTLELARVKHYVDLILTRRVFEQLPVLKTAFKQRVLQHPKLRDPRVPRNQAKWLGISEEARRAFIRWLSADDISFFFEHVLPDHEDPQGRKQFWLRYVKSVQLSRPLLCHEDRQRLMRSPAYQDMQERNFGRIEGNPVTSAFLLDFGPLLVVEFSREGNACYVYKREDSHHVVPDFWMDEPFSSETHIGLKQSLLAQKVTHRGWWEDRMQKLLAEYGILSS